MSHHDPKLVIFLLLLLPLQAVALESDREQPIDIIADRVTIDEKTGISEYQGNVHLSQGSIQVKADYVRVHQLNGRLQKITIRGQQASFQQQPDNSQTLVHSLANHMEYNAAKEQLDLNGDAKVWQGDNRLSGEHIEYNTRTSTVTANKGASGENRVHAVIIPSESNTPSQ